MQKIKNKIERTYPLAKIEGSDLQRTLFFDTRPFDIGESSILPGQFFMIRYNGCQKPISVSHYENGRVGFTVLMRGKCTNSFINAQVGDYFGLTGPLGNSFTISNYENALLIGGGIGTAPLFFLASNIQKKVKHLDILFGAKSADLLEYSFRLKALNNVNCLFYTEDNSTKHQGFVTEDLANIVGKTKYDGAYLCGPEIMMKKSLDIIKNKVNNVQISMERYMKCGIGICGSCVLDNIGLRVCQDGPIFDAKTLLQSKEFGNYHRNSEGVIERF